MFKQSGGLGGPGQPGGPQDPVPMQNLIVMMVLIALMYVAYITFFPPAPSEPAHQETIDQSLVEQPTASVDSDLLAKFDSRGQIPITSLDEDGVVRASGEIDVATAGLHDLIMPDYRQTIDADSPPVDMLNSPTADLFYYFDPTFNMEGANGSLSRQNLTFEQVAAPADQPDQIVLQALTDNQVRVTVTYQPAGQHLYQVTMSAENLGDQAQEVVLSASLRRAAALDGSGNFAEIPGVQTIWTARQGAAYFEDGRVKRQAYNQIAGTEGNQVAGQDWIALADKYFMTAVLRAPGTQGSAFYNYDQGDGVFSAGMSSLEAGRPTVLRPAETTRLETFLFAGPKELPLLQEYEARLQAEQFVFTIDFGWFWYFTMPFTMVLEWLGDLVGNVGVAILLITIVIKLILFPLANNSYRSMARMKKLQPKLEVLKEKHGDDRQAMSQATMALYREEGANPIAGCLPMLVQIPIFFALYKVIFNTIVIRHAPFFGWIQDMSVADPTNWMNLFGLLPYDLPAFLSQGGVS